MSRVGVVVFLICAIQVIHSQLTDTEKDPVDLLKVKHVKIANFEGILDDHMTKLIENVETLQLSNCTFKPMYQNFLNPLKNLRKLSADNSILDRNVNDIKNCCKKLTEIYLTSSGLAKIDWEQIGSWPLEKIHFFREKVPELPANMLPGSKLKELTIEFSNIETINEAAFSKFKDLELLNLQNNKIKEITKKMLEPLQNVKEINLRYNLLEKLTAEQFPLLPNLEKLNVGHNPIKIINFEGIKAMAPKLRQVDISGIEIDMTKAGSDVKFVQMSIL